MSDEKISKTSDKKISKMSDERISEISDEKMSEMSDERMSEILRRILKMSEWNRATRLSMKLLRILINVRERRSDEIEEEIEEEIKEEIKRMIILYRNLWYWKINHNDNEDFDDLG